MSIKPVGDRLLVKPVKAEEKTSSGIILTSSASKANPNVAEVIAIGNGEKIKDVKIGDKIIHSEYAGTKVKDNNEEYIIIDFESVLGIME